MKKVRIISNQFDTPTTLARVIMERGISEARIYTYSEKLEATLNKGIYNPILEKTVKPIDGEAFIDALQYTFKSGYYGVIEEED